MKKYENGLLLIGIVIMLVVTIPTTKAFDFDNVKNYDSVKKEITIKNAFGIPFIGNTLAKYKLESNTDYCLIDCYASGKATLYTDGYLFQELNFKNKKNKFVEIQSNKILIEVTEEYIDYKNEYDLICVEKLESNLTQSNNCVQQLNKEIPITKQRKYFKEYNNEILPAGDYNWRIEGKKNPKESVDWIGKAFGNDLTEWAWWDSDWNYKKKITFTENQGINWRNYSFENLSIAMNANMQADCEDFRFTDNLETYELGYNITNCDGTAANVTVKIPTLIASGTTDIYFYYGNVLATATGSSEDAYLYYNNFNSALWGNDWFDVSDGTSNISVSNNGYFLLNSSTTASQKALALSRLNYTDENNNNSWSLEVKLKFTSTGAENGHLMFIGASDKWTSGKDYDTADVYKNATELLWYKFIDNYRGVRFVSGTYGNADILGTNAPTTERTLTIIKKEANASYFSDGSYLGSYADLSSGNKGIVLAARGAGNSEYSSIKVDYVKLMRYAEIPPTYIIGDEDIIGKIVVSLTRPNDNYISYENIVFFNSSFTAISFNLTNATLYVWNSDNSLFGENTSSTVTGVQNGTSLSLSGFNIGNYLWNYYACAINSSGLLFCNFADANRTLDITPAVTEEYYSTSSYESQTDNFHINLTSVAGYVPTTAYLNYNGTNYAATVSSLGSSTYQIYKNNLTIPLTANWAQETRQFYFNYYLNNTYYKNSSFHNQTIGVMNLSSCFGGIGGNNLTYINYTFKDEVSTSLINSSIASSYFSYGLSANANVLRSYSKSVPTEYSNYSLCFLPKHKSVYANYSIAYSASGYPQRRTSSASLSAYNNITDELTLELLSASDGIYSTFQTQTSQGGVITGVSIIVEKLVSGVWTVIESGTTDSAGSITFFLDPDIDVRITASKSGYTTEQVTIRPTQTLYTIILGSTSGNYTEYNSFEGIKYIYYPSSGIITKSSAQVFGLNLTASKGNVNQCKFELLNSSESVLNSTTGCGAYGGNITLTYNTQLDEIYLGRISVNLSGNGTFFTLESDAYWRPFNATNASDLTIANFFNRMKTLKAFGDESGRAEFSRIVMFYFLLIICLSVLGYSTGLEIQSPGAVLFILALSITFASFTGFMELSGISTINWLDKYFIACIVDGFALGYMFNVWRKT